MFVCLFLWICNRHNRLKLPMIVSQNFDLHRTSSTNYGLCIFKTGGNSYCISMTCLQTPLILVYVHSKCRQVNKHRRDDIHWYDFCFKLSKFNLRFRKKIHAECLSMKKLRCFSFEQNSILQFGLFYLPFKKHLCNIEYRELSLCTTLSLSHSHKIFISVQSTN